MALVALNDVLECPVRRDVVMGDGEAHKRTDGPEVLLQKHLQTVLQYCRVLVSPVIQQIKLPG